MVKSFEKSQRYSLSDMPRVRTPNIDVGRSAFRRLHVSVTSRQRRRPSALWHGPAHDLCTRLMLAMTRPRWTPLCLYKRWGLVCSRKKASLRSKWRMSKISSSMTCGNGSTRRIVELYVIGVSVNAPEASSCKDATAHGTSCASDILFNCV